MCSAAGDCGSLAWGGRGAHDVGILGLLPAAPARAMHLIPTRESFCGPLCRLLAVVVCRRLLQVLVFCRLLHMLVLRRQAVCPRRNCHRCHRQNHKPKRHVLSLVHSVRKQGASGDDHSHSHRPLHRRPARLLHQSRAQLQNRRGNLSREPRRPRRLGVALGVPVFLVFRRSVRTRRRAKGPKTTRLVLEGFHVLLLCGFRSCCLGASCSARQWRQVAADCRTTAHGSALRVQV